MANNFIKVHKSRHPGHFMVILEHGGKQTTFDGLTRYQANRLEQTLTAKYQNPVYQKLNKRNPKETS